VTTETRARLLSAAERLFAERGIDGVSLREITRASGARNAIAAQYHFEDRAGLVQAILDKHVPEVEARRHAMLDEYQARGEADVRALAGALVRPLASKLADADGGAEFLQIYGQLIDRTAQSTTDDSSSLARWRDLVEPLLDEDTARLHRRFTVILHTTNELARRARSGRTRGDDRLFTSYLIDVVEALLSAPVSDETRRLAKERDARRGSR
jgi:AcrR family transcriptional regulator